MNDICRQALCTGMAGVYIMVGIPAIAIVYILFSFARDALRNRSKL